MPDTPPASRPSWPRRILIGLGILFGLVLLAVAGVAVWLATADLKPLAERLAQKALDRRVTIETLQIGWGRTITVEATGLRLANAPWSQHPDMLHAGRISGRIDAWSLLGTPRVEQLRATDFALRLERGAQRVGNWAFDGRLPDPDKPQSWPPPRQGFPTLLDFALDGGKLTYRTTSGKELVVDARTLTIRAESSTTPVHLHVDGAYNQRPVRIDGTLGPYDVLHDPTVPYPTDLTATVPAGTMRLDGTMLRPLEFDAIDGALHADLRDLGALTALFGAAIQMPLPLVADARFTHSRDDWRLDKLKASFGGMPVTGHLAITEGRPPVGDKSATPDSIDLGLDFEQLDIDRLVSGQGGGGGPINLRPDKDAAILAAKIGAKRASYDVQQFADVALRVKQAPNLIEIEQLRFGVWGGTATVEGKADAGGRGTTLLDLVATLDGINAAALLKLLGAPGSDLAGNIDAALNIRATGDTLPRALATSRGDAAITMTRGRIATAILEKISIDLRSLFRRNDSTTPIECFAAVLRLREGIATLQPLRLRTTGANVAGEGAFDLTRRELDITVGSERASTGTFALDIPIRVHGPFSDLRIGPTQHRPQPTFAGGLSAPVSRIAMRNPCNR